MDALPKVKLNAALDPYVKRYLTVKTKQWAHVIAKCDTVEVEFKRFKDVPVNYRKWCAIHYGVNGDPTSVHKITWIIEGVNEILDKIQARTHAKTHREIVHEMTPLIKHEVLHILHGPCTHSRCHGNEFMVACEKWGAIYKKSHQEPA